MNVYDMRLTAHEGGWIYGRYALYTGRGIGWALCESMEHPKIGEEIIVDKRVFYTIKEGKNGQGPPPLKTEKGCSLSPTRCATLPPDCAASFTYFSPTSRSPGASSPGPAAISWPRGFRARR